MVLPPPISTLFPYTTLFRSPLALSRAGARGIWQFVAWRGNEYGLKHTWWIDERDRKSTRLNSSHANISYAVFCLKKKKYHMPATHADSNRPESAVDTTGQTL